MNEQSVLNAITQEMALLPGHLGFYYKNLSTGFEYGVREQEDYLAASVIKLPLFLHVLSCCQEGKLSLDDRLTVTEDMKMPSCGGLSLFTGTVEPDIRTLCRMMIDLSDNTATNVLIRHCGIPQINARFRSWGLQKTVLRRLLFDSEAASRGLENTISPKEMGCLLEKLYRRQLLSAEHSQYALEVLMQQQINHKLDGKLQGEVDIAHKTGEDTDLSNDVGILYASQPFILCFTGHNTPRYPWEDLIRRSAYALVHCQEE